MNQQLIPVLFYGDTLYLVEHKGEAYTPLKPIVDALGVNWASQTAKLNNKAARWGVAMIATPSPGGPQEMLCVPVRKLPAYLASIDSHKVSATAKPKVELYQAECDEALWRHWAGQAAPTAAVPAVSTARTNVCERLLAHVDRLMSAVPVEYRKAMRASCEAAVTKSLAAGMVEKQTAALLEFLVSFSEFPLSDPAIVQQNEVIKSQRETIATQRALIAAGRRELKLLRAARPLPPAADGQLGLGL